MQPLPRDVQYKMLNIPYNNYKTQRCKYYDDTGNCKFGNNCTYAHGDPELRNPYDNLPVAPIMTGLMPDQQAVQYEMYNATDSTNVSNEKAAAQSSEVKLLVNSTNETEI